MFRGSAVAIVTPFNHDKSINYKSFEKLLEFHLINDTDAIVVCGTTGESSTLTDEEKLAMIEFSAKKIDGKIPVIAGTGSNNTMHAKNLTLQAKNCGADAALVVTPYYNKTTQNGIVEHYKEISKADLPIIIYNVPSRTGLNILPDTYNDLLQIKNVIGVKEASANISQIMQIKYNVNKFIDENKNNFYIYSGNDDQIVPTLSLGGDGVISVLANIFPKQVHQICEKYFSKDIESSLELQLEFLPLINDLFCEVNPIPIKYAMNKMGFDVGEYRLPLTKISNENEKRLNDTLTRLNV